MDDRRAGTPAANARLSQRGNAEQLPDAGDARELGEERADRRDAEAGDRKPGPATPERGADQLAMPLAGEDAEAHRHLLHEEQDRDQDELRQQQAGSPTARRSAPR